jgi:UDP-N-acetylglucosamine/UDP-N-acetylgalactosamine diphosphorylase
MIDEKKLRERYEKAGQGHVFKYVNDLNETEKHVLFNQLNDIKVEELHTIVDAARQQDSKNNAITINNNNATNLTIEPFVGTIGRTADKELVSRSYRIGLEVIGRGQVAAVVLAGGQGTRLGYSGPKGMYNIGLPSGSSLFQLVSQRIRRLSQIASCTLSSSLNDINNTVAQQEQEQHVPLYIMTSPLNHNETEEYFRSNNFFGLGQRNVSFFQQGMLPCVTETDGKIIMETKFTVSMAPDGNGGIYPSLQLSGTLDKMKQRGIQYVHVFSIDNALVKPADPVFVGYCIKSNADCGNKCVWKSHPHEAVGVVATRNNKPCIVEYSEISKEMAERVDNNGKLLFGAGNICNHFYTIDFIENSILPNMGTLYHIAKKKIPYYDPNEQRTIIPTSNNGIKLETFIFDAFPLSNNMAILDVQRSTEFAPVKNASGSDSPATARQMISSLSKQYLQNAGAQLIHPETTNNNDTIQQQQQQQEEAICEISPLTSYAGEGLEKYNGQTIDCPFQI